MEYSHSRRRLSSFSSDCEGQPWICKRGSSVDKRKLAPPLCLVDCPDQISFWLSSALSSLTVFLLISSLWATNCFCRVNDSHNLVSMVHDTFTHIFEAQMWATSAAITVKQVFWDEYPVNVEKSKQQNLTLMKFNVALCQTFIITCNLLP